MNFIPFGFKHMKKLGNHFGHPRASHLVDPATGWIQEFQTQIHSGGKPKLRVKYKKPVEIMSYH
jgi:hypothetical protein